MTTPRPFPHVAPEGDARLGDVSHVLLDIEGTTCPVSFVAETLFPYATAHLSSFLAEQGDDPEVRSLMEATRLAWRDDPDPEARILAQSQGATAEDYLKWLIHKDRKFPPLKDLQGRIWEAGYRSGDLIAPLFDDVAPALRRWQGQGLVLGVYSSGSIAAQQLLYAHTLSGDLRDCFSFWFDTRTGAKLQPQSYKTIAAHMDCSPAAILFVSDSLPELHAATAAGMRVLFSDRPDNPHRDPGPFARIENYSRLF